MFDFLSQQKGQPPALPEGTVRRRYSIEGQVQGVGFRYRARYAAQSLGLTGWVENEDDARSRWRCRATRPSSSGCSPSSSAAIISRSPRSTSATSPPTHGNGISGYAATDKCLLQTRSPPESCIPGGCCVSIRSSSALYFERVHYRGVLLYLRLSQIRGKCV